MFNKTEVTSKLANNQDVDFIDSFWEIIKKLQVIIWLGLNVLRLIRIIHICLYLLIFFINRFIITIVI